MACSTVMILSGMSGSGKSTALRGALTSKHPLFGTAKDAVFQATQLPPVHVEDYLTLDDRMKHRTWVHELDLIFLHQRGVSGLDLVVHFDIYWYLASVYCFNNKAAFGDQIGGRLIEFLHSPESISKIYRGVFSLLPLRGADCAVRVLKPEYGELCARWKNRESRLDRSRDSGKLNILREYVYSGDKRGMEIYESIYEGWGMALGV